MSTKKPARSRKRKRKDDDEEYDFAAEVKKRKKAEAKEKKRASINLLKSLLKRSNFYANSLLSVITEQQQKEKKRAEASLRKRKEKLKKIEAKVRKDYGKKCQDIPMPYRTFLESEENQVFFGEKPCFRVAVVVSHLVKKARLLSKNIIPEPLSADEVSDIAGSHYKKIDEILSCGSKAGSKPDISLKNEQGNGSKSQNKSSCSQLSQPSYVENVISHINPNNHEVDVVSDVMTFILDKIDNPCGVNMKENVRHIENCEIMADIRSVMDFMLDQVVTKTSVECQSVPESIEGETNVVVGKSGFHDDFGMHDDVTPVSLRLGYRGRMAALKCKRSIDLNEIAADQDMKHCRLIVDKLLDDVSSLCQKFDGSNINTNGEDATLSMPDIVIDEKGCKMPDSVSKNSNDVEENQKMKQNISDPVVVNQDETPKVSINVEYGAAKESMTELQPCTQPQDNVNNGPQISSSLIPSFEVPCPICDRLVKESKINEHLDSCILGGERRESLRRKCDRPPKVRRRVKNEKVIAVDSANSQDTSTRMPADVTCDINSGDIPETITHIDAKSTDDTNGVILVNKESNPWKVLDSSILESSSKPNKTSMPLAPIDEVEGEETGESSSESEAEVLLPTVELRRSTRTSRCQRSFKEDSDEDCDEYMPEESAEEDSNNKKGSEKKHDKHKGVAAECQDKTPASIEMMKYTKETYLVGDVVKIQWGQGEAGRLYKAKILDRCPADDGNWTYLIHYIGWSDAYDDWIFSSDIASVIQSYSDENESQSQEYKMPQGGSLLDEKFYLPGHSRKNAPSSMLTEKNGIRYFKDFEINPAQPKLFTGGALRKYQITGYEWLKILLENGENSILADEMGLGKTIQCISIIAKLVEVGIKGPFLICAPMSTIQNWFQEFRRFAPKIPLLLYHGTGPERETLSLCMFHRGKRFKTRPVVITTYDILLRDHHVLQMHRWSYMILDEGHRIKNLKCKLLKELRLVQSQQKLLLTGTPLQNNLSELWSLLNFLLPEVFDDLETFETWFDIGKLQKNQKLLLIIHKILTPFLLRRMKADVDLQLPPKKEMIVYARLMSKQERFYRALVNRSIKELVNQKEYYNTTAGVASPDAIAQQRNSQDLTQPNVSTDNSKAERNGSDVRSNERVMKHFSMSNIIMQLRKCCNHPYLIEEPCENEESIDEEMISCSGKMMILDKILPKLKKRGHKVLIFSQMTKMLDILEDYCFLRGFRNVRLDGQMRRDDRVASMNNFTKDPDIFVFLLSTRAGGLGINLTAADTVILYDSDWNPQNDAQAMDRCHRIGQEKPVLVYRLVTSGTVDEQVVERASKKLALEKLIMHKDLFKGNLEQELTSQNTINPEELLQLLESSKSSGLVEDTSDKFDLSDERIEMLLDRSSMMPKT